MSCLHYQGATLAIEKVKLEDVARQFGTPCYVYSRAALEKNWHAFDKAFSSIPHQICYAVKANSNVGILALLAKLNSGFDIVSLGELERVIAAGGDPKKIVFSGVGKTSTEIEKAMDYGIFCFDVESEPELERLQSIAKTKNQKIDIALRVNPNVNPNTHSHISTGLKENKFGIDANDILPLCQKIMTQSHLNLVGIACHIGSQITQVEPFLLALDRLLEIHAQLKANNIAIRHLNIGGGLGIIYRDEKTIGIEDYGKLITEKIVNHPIHLIIEPGRAIVGNAGVLLTKVEYLKHADHKNFAIVDAGMNDLMRPALYDAWHDILPVSLRQEEKRMYEIAGPVCESADFLGKHRELALRPNDLLAVDSAGAYGFSMSSNYNSRCKPAEVLVDDEHFHLIRRRETINELFASETML